MPPLDRHSNDHERFGYAFIKSGYEDIQDDLLGDFADNGLEVIHERKIILPSRVIDYVYRESMNEHFYAAMRLHLIENPVINMVLYRDAGNAQGTLLDLKFGKNGHESLRAKYAHAYQPLSDDEINAWIAGNHPFQHEVTIRLTQHNVFHTADSTEEAFNTLRLLGSEYHGYYDANDVHPSRLGQLGILLATLGLDATIGENYGEL